MVDERKVPEDWASHKVEDISIMIASGTSKTKTNKNGDFPIYGSTGEIGRSIKYDYEGRKILVARVGANAGTLYTVDGKYLVSDNTLMIEIKKSVSFRYIYRVLKYLNLNKLVFGSGQPLITGTQLKEIVIDIPSLSEQKAIAEALSDTDNLILSLEKLIDKKKKIKQGAMQQLLTGKKRLPGFSGEWRKVKVKDIGYAYGGLSGKSKSDFDGGNKPYITFLNVMNNTIIEISSLRYVRVKSSESQNRVNTGDLLFNTSSETPEEVGMCSVLLGEIDELYLNSFCFGFRIYDQNLFEPLYLAYFFRSNEGRKLFFSLAQGATRYNLSKNLFYNIEFKHPSIQEQKAIAQVLSDMDNEIEALEEKLEKYKTIKQGMMQELLTGRIRLI